MPQQSDPVRLVHQDELEVFRRWMDDFFGLPERVGSRAGEAWTPAMDVYETHDEIVIKLSVPGMKSGHIHVHFEGDVVTISGYRECPPEAGVAAYHRMEIPNGRFERRVAIRKPVDPEGASAQYRDGFLWICIPKVGVRAHTVYTLGIRL